MAPEFFRELYDYNFWADRRVWTCIEALSEARFKQKTDYAHGALRDQALHTMGVEYWWLHFLATGELDFIDPEAYPTRASLRARWDEVERQVRAYLAGLTDAELEREVRPEFWDEGGRPIRVRQALFQVANHSTDHRAQMLAVIHRLGGETVGQDFLDYLFER